jgi:hypothetical protein
VTIQGLLHAKARTFRNQSGGALLARWFAAGPSLEVAGHWAAIRLQGWDTQQVRPLFSAGRSWRLNGITGYSGQ